MLLLDNLLKRLIKIGLLTVVGPDGQPRTYGLKGSGPEVTIRFHSRALPWKFIFSPELALGEGYMDGTLTVDDDRLHEFIDLITRNVALNPQSSLGRQNVRFKRLKRFLRQRNTRRTSKRLVAHHYDIKPEMYEAFLDADLQYTCAFFTDDNTEKDLERAQRDKTALITRKLLARPEHRILDIGCGWGGAAIMMHELTGARVTGITLSKEQLDSAVARAERKGIGEGVEFRLQDYRDVPDVFDRITVVGMLEHVGWPQYKVFFRQLHKLLHEDGIAVLHTIGRAAGPGFTDAWTEKYIFRNSYAPALSEIVSAIEPTGFYITDIEVLRTHYIDTLAEWSRRLATRREEIVAMHDERFYRMFEFYLKISEFAFRNLDHVVFQIQLAKRQDAVPITRAYLAPDSQVDASSSRDVPATL